MVGEASGMAVEEKGGALDRLVADEVTKTSRSIKITIRSWPLVAEDEERSEREDFIVEF